MSLEEIAKLVAPPTIPLFPGDDDSWRAVCARIGIALPACLKDYARIFGSGLFEANQYVCIFNPHDPAYLSNVDWVCENYASLQRESPEFYLYDVFPAKGGLFPIGRGAGARAFYILPGTTADRDAYAVVFDDANGGYHVFPGRRLFEFFLAFFCNQVEPIPFFTGTITFIQRPMVSKGE